MLLDFQFDHSEILNSKVDQIKNPTTLYYTNAPPISIIKWPQIFCKTHPKKVLLHTEHSQKLAYVVNPNVGDFFEHCSRLPIYGLV